MAYGLDRMVMLMLKKDSIRDVIAFPKVQNAGEPMRRWPPMWWTRSSWPICPLR